MNPEDLVQLKKHYGMWGPGTHAKVTSSFWVQMGPKRAIKCRRVRIGADAVFHVSELEFHRLFEARK